MHTLKIIWNNILNIERDALQETYNVNLFVIQMCPVFLAGGY